MHALGWVGPNSPKAKGGLSLAFNTKGVEKRLDTLAAERRLASPKNGAQERVLVQNPQNHGQVMCPSISVACANGSAEQGSDDHTGPLSPPMAQGKAPDPARNGYETTIT